MTEDREIMAMQEIAKSLSGLDQDVVDRVLRWASDRYGVAQSPKPLPLSQNGGGGSESHVESPHADSLADLFGTIRPKTGPQKALIVAYWLQKHEGLAEWASQRVNSELKHLGHRVGNITDALTSLRNQSPSLAIQTRKQGSTRQARKLYKLTHAGIQAVEEMLA